MAKNAPLAVISLVPFLAGGLMGSNSRRYNELFVSAARSFQQTTWQPSVDIYRTSHGWLLKYELAGVAPSEVEVGVHERSVTVRGRRRDVRIEDNQQSYCMEISYNQFERTVNLPCDLSLMDARVDYRDGMLLVQLICREGEA